jgi:phage-related protein
VSRKITIEFLGDSKDLQNAMGDADSKGGKLSGTLKKVGKMAAVGLAAGAAAGAVGLYKLTQGAIEDEAAQARLEKQLKNSAGATDKQVAATEDWITAQGKALGVTDDELRPALSKLVTATGDVAEAQDLASLAMDAAAGTGKSLEGVSLALMKARNGDIAGLGRLGIATKNAAGETMTFEQITKSMADTFGGQAATQANTLEGKMDRLKLILSETGETIGSKLIPKVTELADWFLNKGLPAAMAFGGWLGDTFPPIFERIRTVVSSVMAGLQGDVGGGLGQVQAIFSSVVSIVTSLWNTFGSTILSYATTTLENMKQVFGGALDVISGIFQTFSALLQGDWSGAWDGIKKILSGAWEMLKGIVKQGLNVLSTAMEIGWTVMKGIVGLAWDGIKTLVSAGIGKVVDFLQAIPGKFTSALSSLKSTAGEIFREAMDAGKEKVTGIGGTIVSWIADIPGKLREKIGNFKDAGAALIGAFVDGMKNAAGVIEGIAGNVWSAVRTLLNSALDKVDAALTFTIDLPGPKDISFNPPIPRLAKGGLVNKPTLALIGEDGPEAVVPLSKKHNPGGTMPGMGGGGSSAPILLQLMLPGGKVIEQLLIQHTRDAGRPLQVSTLGPTG